MAEKAIIEVPSLLRARLQEWADLSPQTARGEDIPLVVTLTTTVTSATDTFKVPAEFDVLVWGIVGFLRFNAFANETNAVGTVNPSIIDRVYLKSCNCLIDLRNTDNETRLIQDSTPLSAYMQTNAGFSPLWPVPHKLPAGSTVELKGALQDTTASIVGGSTDYGVRLICDWVRIKG